MATIVIMAPSRKITFQSTVELRHEGDAVHRVVLKQENGGELPSEATYRNLVSFSELKVTVDTVERVDSHPSDIWYLVP